MLLLFFWRDIFPARWIKGCFFPIPLRYRFRFPYFKQHEKSGGIGWAPHLWSLYTTSRKLRALWWFWLSIRCRQPRRIITLNLTIIMAYMRRDKKRWGSCVLGWISVMVSGRNFRNVRSGMENMRENPSGCNRLNTFCGGRWNARRIGRCTYSPLDCSGWESSGHLSGWRDHPSFSTSYFTKSGQLRVRGDWLFCLNGVIRGARLWRKGGYLDGRTHLPRRSIEVLPPFGD